MTQNMEFFFNTVKDIINKTYTDTLPTQDQIESIAEEYRIKLVAAFPLTDDEFENIKKRLPQHILHSIGYADTLRSRDSSHQYGWYKISENNGFLWERYKQYLEKKWNKESVNRLHDTTDDIMNDIGNPKSDNPFQRRGLLLGDVQSGKTATYTAICNKSADAGYKVIIVLAGTMENLRIQTQERLDAEFVGLDSKYDFDKKADSAMRNKSVGVGKIPLPEFGETRRITRFTSVATDFNTNAIKSNGLNLNDLNGTALFVVKKNKSVLNNLYKWLTKDEAVLNLPMLLIDDEADNASVNTNSDETNPTAINAAINKILRCFKQATYLGITATPFANIFIDPDLADDGAAKDLFPRHFLTLLPKPDNYIGADKIFGSGTTDEDIPKDSGLYASSIVPIYNDEQTNFYVFKHKKELAEDLYDLPPSLKDAILYFLLITAISDTRYDINAHRTMMINVSRFTKVQDKTADLVTAYIKQVKSDVENYAHLPDEQAMRIKNIAHLKKIWLDFNLESKADFSWEEMLKKHLFKTIKRIEVRSVNQRSGAKSLDYYNYKETGMRVIAIGGNSLSRGLTLEGLCVSYFYRNTMMYDALLQMGRWFGYRPNYEDLFKIWIGEDIVGWYSYITDAFNELKSELRTMARQHLTPEDFGLKVRQDPGSLIVTARNKMRSGTPVSVPITLSQRMIETPRLLNDISIIKENNTLCESVIKSINNLEGLTYTYDAYTKAYIWKNVPREYVMEIVKNYKSHPWNLNFQAHAISDFIESEDSLSLWDVAIPSGSSEETYKLILNDTDSLDLRPEKRKISKDNSFEKMLRVNERHVRVGSGGCTKIGLSKEQIKQLRQKASKPTDRTYLIEDRNPLALIHLMQNTNDDTQSLPKYIYAIGLGFPGGKEEKQANYVVNTIELQNYIDISDVTDEDDENDI